MALMGSHVEIIGDGSLEKWEYVGSGGFGAVYKAYHKDWGFDVAIKILRDDRSETGLWREAKFMRVAACKYVPRLYGLFHGVPLAETTPHRGIVMDFMERGSIWSLLTALSAPPPWPLAFRIANQIALGMNFLHAQELMHFDLHPKNVLLDEDLNAKLVDFGLSRVPASVLTKDGGTEGDSPGFYKYTPPEAFAPLYKPSRAYDRYSYGILLWSILTGKEVYPGCEYSLVALRIPIGDRPPLEGIDVRQAEGLKEMVELMESLWSGDPTRRKTFKECCGVTGHVYSKHSSQIAIAVHEVLTLLDKQKSSMQSVASPPRRVPSGLNTCDLVNRKPMAKCPSERREDIRNSITRISGCQSHEGPIGNSAKARFVTENRNHLIRSVTVAMAVTDELGGMVHSEIYRRIFKEDFCMDQMRLLYMEVLDEGSERVQAAFYDAVKKHQFSAIEKLGGR